MRLLHGDLAVAEVECLLPAGRHCGEAS
jgi:hypothetical protein